MKKTDTFSANSLKILDISAAEFENKYIYNLFYRKKDQRAIQGQKFHSLICFYIKNFDISKLTFDLNEKELKIWQNLKSYLDSNILQEKNQFIKTEYPFLIKENLTADSFNKPYYLTGRFDAIMENCKSNTQERKITIYDWKTLNIPKEAQDDLQSIVYLFCANKIFKTQNLKIRYLSIEKLEFVDVEFKNSDFYKKRLDKIILKHWMM